MIQAYRGLASEIRADRVKTSCKHRHADPFASSYRAAHYDELQLAAK